MNSKGSALKGTTSLERSTPRAGGCGSDQAPMELPEPQATDPQGPSSPGGRPWDRDSLTSTEHRAADPATGGGGQNRGASGPGGVTACSQPHCPFFPRVAIASASNTCGKPNQSVFPVLDSVVKSVLCRQDRAVLPSSGESSSLPCPGAQTVASITVQPTDLRGRCRVEGGRLRFCL